MAVAATLGILAGCAGQPPTPAVEKAPNPTPAPNVPVLPKFSPDPMAAVPQDPPMVARRCDFSVVLPADELFTSRRVVLTEHGAVLLARQVIEPASECASLELIAITGHADPLGNKVRNQSLSERRAEVIKAFLVARGIASARISAIGAGASVPVHLNCDDNLPRRELEACLAPDRRVVIEAHGTAR